MKKLKIITISGKAGSGKSYLAHHLKEYLEIAYGMKGYIIHFADPLKMVCEKIYHWDGQKGESGRKLLQTVGTDIVQKNNKLCWVNCVTNIIRGLSSEFDFVIVGDARFKHELNGLFEVFDSISEYKIFTIQIVNNAHDNGLSEEQKNHISETDVDGYGFDYIMDNNNYNLYIFFKQLNEIIDLIDVY